MRSRDELESGQLNAVIHTSFLQHQHNIYSTLYKHNDHRLAKQRLVSFPATGSLHIVSLVQLALITNLVLDKVCFQLQSLKFDLKYDFD
jgi:hypothetical protein